jgi:hypothetical protein
MTRRVANEFYREQPILVEFVRQLAKDDDKKLRFLAGGMRLCYEALRIQMEKKG